jgi:hypothetical protein
MRSHLDCQQFEGIERIDGEGEFEVDTSSKRVLKTPETGRAGARSFLPVAFERRFSHRLDDRERTGDETATATRKPPAYPVELPGTGDFALMVLG